MENDVRAILAYDENLLALAGGQAFCLGGAVDRSILGQLGSDIIGPTEAALRLAG